ncbi:MAG TPA: tetratricopeptide repeat protein, partial [Methylophilaceae bacterium]|nr:tetratricopeptide repeat protein [Methylophilaceae bacterium]
MKSAINVGAKIAALLLVAVMLVSCGGKEARMAKYMEKGKDYMEQQNYDKARVEFKNVLQIDPKYAEAYYLLGKIEESKANWQKAFGDYFKAVELDPNHIAAQASLGRFYLLS